MPTPHQSQFHPSISPSKARRDAAEAKEWAHISAWLTKKYSPQPVPRFERNSETKQALRELVMASEAADREVELVQRAEREELRRYEEAAARSRGVGNPCREMVEVVVQRLDEEGTKALRELAEASLRLGSLSPDAREMGRRIVELTQAKFEMEEQLRRIAELQSRLEREVDAMRKRIDCVQAREDEVEREEIQQQTAQLNREMRQVTVKVGEYNEQIATLERLEINSPDIGEVKEQECTVRKSQAKVKALERLIANFHNLPPDLEMAKGEYQRAKSELQELKRQRDALFQEMIVL